MENYKSPKTKNPLDTLTAEGPLGIKKLPTREIIDIAFDLALKAVDKIGATNGTQLYNEIEKGKLNGKLPEKIKFE